MRRMLVMHSQMLSHCLITSLNKNDATPGSSFLRNLKTEEIVRDESTRSDTDRAPKSRIYIRAMDRGMTRHVSRAYARSEKFSRDFREAIEISAGSFKEK